jgi:hypothetical protein
MNYEYKHRLDNNFHPTQGFGLPKQPGIFPELSIEIKSC